MFFFIALAILDTIIPNSEYYACNLGRNDINEIKSWKEQGCRITKGNKKQKRKKRECKRQSSDPVCLGALKCFESNTNKTQTICKSCYR